MRFSPSFSYRRIVIAPSQVLLLFHLITSNLGAVSGTSVYYGKYLGPLKSYHHGLNGDIYAVDARTLHIRNFSYDGEGPAAYFYGSSGKQPGINGFKIRDERGSVNPLKKYSGEHLTITLPEGLTLHDIKWFYVWCEDFSVNFGDVKIPYHVDYPKPQKIDGLSGIHGVSSDNIVVVDAQTLLIPGFSYDGEAPDAKFWVGAGEKPTPQGLKVADENGKETPLRRYNRKTIVLTLPGDLTVFDIGHFGVWCEAFTVDFGHITIPPGLNIPPSLKMLGVLPQSKLNCEVLHEPLGFEVRWAIAGDSIVIQLVAKLDFNQYMSFGLSGSSLSNRMIGGDVVVAGVDQDTTSGFAQDYYLLDKSQCVVQQESGQVSGSCPDTNIQGPVGESVRLLNAAVVNGYSIVTYQRPLKSRDNLDLSISINSSQPIIWAIGPLNDKHEVSYHQEYSKETIKINFGRLPQWNCPIPDTDSKPVAVATVDVTSENIPVSTKSETLVQEVSLKKKIRPQPVPNPSPVQNNVIPWEIPPIQCFEPEDGVFYAQMGPTGGKHGYSAITGHVGWGISWYINGLLIPEINVVRGQTYTFVVEGGQDPEIPAKYHPFYITDDPVGGFGYKTHEERANIRIFAGVSVSKSGEIVPTGIGRSCNWTPDPKEPSAEEFVSFGAYQRTLSLICEQGDPGIVQWTPDANTPNTVYYQCFTHRHLGWKINVLDSCNKEQPETEMPNTQEDLQSRGSIQYTTRVKPDINKVEITKNSENIDHLTLIPTTLENNLKKDFTKLQHAKPDYFPTAQNFTLSQSSNHSYSNILPFYNSQLHYGSPQPLQPTAHKYILNDNTYRPLQQLGSVPVPNYYNQPLISNIYNQPIPAASFHFQTQATKSSSFDENRRPVVNNQQMFFKTHQNPQISTSHVPKRESGKVPPKPNLPIRSVVYKKPIHKFPSHGVAINHHGSDAPTSPSQLNYVPLSKKYQQQPYGQHISQTVSVSYSTSKNNNNNSPLLNNHNHHRQYSHQLAQHQKQPQILMRNAQILNGEQTIINNSALGQTHGGFNPSTIIVEGGFKPIFPENSSALDRISENINDGTTDLLEGTTVKEFSEALPENHKEKKKMSKKLLSKKLVKVENDFDIETTTAQTNNTATEFSHRHVSNEHVGKIQI